jgi:hypothetical protein
LTLRVFLAAYGATQNVNIITGYSTAVSLVQGFVRGDGQATGTALSTLDPEIVGGIAVPILADHAASPGQIGYAATRKVPTIASYALSNPPPTASGRADMATLQSFLAANQSWMFVSPGTPAKYRLALEDAVKWAFARGSVRALMTSSGGSTKLVSPALEPAAVEKAVADVSVMQKILGINPG